ncbi:MAG TPA: hypothetical protein VF755_12000 [Catenuloplanes sp.]
MHTPLFSVVFRFYPKKAPVLVVIDAMPDYAVRVDLDESPEARFEVMRMISGVLINMQISGAGDIRARI